MIRVYRLTYLPVVDGIVRGIVARLAEEGKRLFLGRYSVYAVR
jgi:hypothetical protein